MRSTKNHWGNDAQLCRDNGWGVGTKLVGDEGYGPKVIEITALGERTLLAKSADGHESSWTLSCREWTEAARSQEVA